MRLLALHTLGHDTSLCVFNEDELEFACESERASRICHDADIDHALTYLWRNSGLKPADIDHLVFSSPGLDAVARIDGSPQLAQRVRAGKFFAEGTSHLLGQPLPCTVVLHEAAHAALGAHYAGWRDDCLVVVNEGWGSFSQNSTFRYASGELSLLELDSLRWFGTGFGWSTISSLLGIGDLPSSPGKTMAIGGYGSWSDDAAELICRTDPGYTPSAQGWQVAQVAEIESYLAAHPHFDERADFVHTFQTLFSNEVLDHCQGATQRHRCTSLSMSGGCALNLHANSNLRAALAAHVAIPPNCNDSGQAIGAAVVCLQMRFGIQPAPFSVYSGGASIDAVDGADALRKAGFKVRGFDASEVAALLADGRVVALAQGHSELGPRALGNRSLLASACTPGMRRRVSEQLKGREWYRPLGCVISSEAFRSVFPGQLDSPYMLFSYVMPDGQAPEGRHVDGSSRIQTVDRQQNHRLWSILNEHATIAGQPLLINTSLNSEGRPIACSVGDVLDDFLTRDVDAFVFDDVMALRSN